MNIEGNWYNGLGSTMVITAVSDGQLVGTYTTAVSSDGCAQGSFDLVGLTDTDGVGDGVAFVVNWINSRSTCYSVTAWSGQAQNINGEDQINAFWLLTVESSSANNWSATHVGQDVFTRSSPSADQVAGMSKLLRRSHP